MRDRLVEWITHIPRLRSLCGWMVVFWTCNIPPFTLAFFVLKQDMFVKLSLLYLGEVSIIALVAAFGSWWQSLRIEEHQQDDADVSEVLEAVKEQSNGG